MFYITKGESEEILKNKLPLEMMPAISINMIQENFAAHHGMPKEVDLGQVITALLEDRCFIVPRIVVTKGTDFKIAGAAIFNNENKFIGWLGEWDMEGYNLVIGDVENAVIEVPYKDDLFVFETDNQKTKVKYELKDGIDHFHLEIMLEGFFVESWLTVEEIAEVETLQKFEKSVEKEVGKKVTEIIEKMQNEFYADIFEFHRGVEKKNNQRWKKIKDNWDGEGGFFQRAEVTVDAKVKIRHYMTKERVT